MRLLSLETFRLGVNNLRLHKLRSLLTSLGIIFGVAAVICMLSISEGASADAMRLIELLGTQNIIVNSVKPPQNAQSSERNSSLIAYGVTREDVARISETVPHIKSVVPLKTVAFKTRQGEHQVNTNVIGTVPAFFDIVKVSIGRGRPITAEDMSEKSNVCVLGADVAKQLFPTQDPIGERVLAERYPTSIPFTVVGILGRVKTAGAPARDVHERNLNREILIPLSTATSQFSDTTRRMGAGSREFIKMQYSGLYLAVDEREYVKKVAAMVEGVFHYGHKKADYEIKVPLRALELAQRKKHNDQITLGFIAGISLLVGGIGIMNIMLASVTERTREIGVRRALGAKQRHITVQFLVETVVLSTAGGMAGAILGILGAHFVSGFAGWETIVSAWSVAVSFGLSVFIGIFFGMYPAISAARLDPIDALRHE